MKTEPVPTFDGVVASLRFPAAEDSGRPMISSVVRFGWRIFPLILLAAALCCDSLRGATNTDAANYETPPSKPGSIQWELNQRLNKERQELYRKRVPIPDAAGGNVLRANEATSFGRQNLTMARTSEPPANSGIFINIFWAAVSLVLVGIVLAWKFAPGLLTDLNERFNPWAFIPVSERVFPAKVRSEEEAFARFLTSFRIGPSASTRTGPPLPGDPVQEFYARAANILGRQRMLLQDIERESSGLARQKKLTNLASEMNALKVEAGFPEALAVWQVTSAVEGLLMQLTDKMGNVTPSTLRAVAGGVDLLGELCLPGLKPDLLADRPLKFLVVDDDLISRQALSLALKKAFSQPDLCMDGETALLQARQQAYDVIFLDVQLPGMDGFELCTKIHDTATNRNTPVVFVTGQSDFDARAHSTLSGGNDLMGKPFLTFEVTVKALTLALQGRLQGSTQKSSQKLAVNKGRENLLVPITPPARPVASSNIIPGSPLATAAATETDEFINAFLIRASRHLEPLRELCQKIVQTQDEAERQSLLADGFLQINSLTPKDSEVAHPAFQMCAALEGLFRKLLENPKNTTASALATIMSAVHLLADLCVPGLKANLATQPPVCMLVVDDDLIARRAITGALQTAFGKPESVESGEAALALARIKPFDVIFLDVIMPGMDGFEVCAKIRDTIYNRATPVVFVTSKNDFAARAEMRRNGGNDLFGKPFLTSEITVKALTFALRGRLDQLKTVLGL
jgi:CheY-like chemotaxis protein